MNIVSNGYYLPENIINTTDLLAEVQPERFGVSRDFIEKNVGVRQVRHTEELPSSLAIKASELALAQANINPDEIGVVIFTGIEGDNVEPATAFTVQAKLGLKSQLCFDISNACLGFMSGIKIAADMIKAGTTKYALVCTGERMSKLSKSLINKLKSTHDATYFNSVYGFLTVGDAGGAMIIGPHKQNAIHTICSDSKGKYANLCRYRYEGPDVTGAMQMGKICAKTIELHLEVYNRALEALGWQPQEIDCLITHQVGQRPHAMAPELFNVPEKKLTKTFDYLGNLTTATLPVNFGLTMESGQIKPGSKVYALISGSGIAVSHMGFTV